MATKRQWQRKLLLESWVNNAASTGDRTTDFNDIQHNLYAWKISNNNFAKRWLKAREDIIA